MKTSLRPIEKKMPSGKRDTIEILRNHRLTATERQVRRWRRAAKVWSEKMGFGGQRASVSYWARHWLNAAAEKKFKPELVTVADVSMEGSDLVDFQMRVTVGELDNWTEATARSGVGSYNGAPSRAEWQRQVLDAAADMVL